MLPFSEYKIKILFGNKAKIKSHIPMGQGRPSRSVTHNTDHAFDKSPAHRFKYTACADIYRNEK